MAFSGNDDVKRRVHDANDIVDVIRSYGVDLKRAGRTWKGLCPFHNEKSPSFNVNAEAQYFKCFGCGKGGDVFTYVMLQERVEFPEALRQLADRAHIEIESRPELAAERKKESDWKSYLYKLNQAAASYYKEALLSKDGQTARDYLVKRGLTEASWEKFGLGYAPAPGKGSSLVGRLQAQKAPVKAILMAGLGSSRDDGSVFDYFRDRLMFPITDSQNRVIAFGGRVLGEGEPKYLNTRETPLFSKSRTIYGLAQARDTMVEKRVAFLAEGYTDVMMCHQHGITNVVAALGTAITPDHVKTLRRLVDEMRILTDSDKAGERAAERSVEILMQEEMPAKVVRLPGSAKDPCDFLTEYGAEAFQEALEQGISLFDFKFQSIARTHDLRSANGQAGAAKELMAIIGQNPNPVVREQYRREVAMRLNVTERSLASMENMKPTRPAEVKSEEHSAEGGVPKPESPLAYAERELLRFLFHQPAWLESVVGDLDLTSLTGRAERVIGKALLKGLDQGTLPPDAKLLAEEGVSPAGSVAKVVLDFLRDPDDAPESGVSLDAAMAVTIALAEESHLALKSKPDEIYSACLVPVQKLRAELEYENAKREVAAAQAAGDTLALEAARRKEMDLLRALKTVKRSA